MERIFGDLPAEFFPMEIDFFIGEENVHHMRQRSPGQMVKYPRFDEPVVMRIKYRNGTETWTSR